MRTIEYTYWQDGDTFLGFLNDHPDYWTQGQTKQELIENLKDIFAEINERLAQHIIKKLRGD